MPKRYFTLVNHSTQPKNKLQKEVWSLFENLSNRIVDDIELAVIEARNKVIDANGMNPRCKPLVVNENRHSDDHVTLYIRLKDESGPSLNFIYHLIKEK